MCEGFLINDKRYPPVQFENGLVFPSILHVKALQVYIKQNGRCKLIGSEMAMHPQSVYRYIMQIRQASRCTNAFEFAYWLGGLDALLAIEEYLEQHKEDLEAAMLDMLAYQRKTKRYGRPIK